MHYIAYVKGKQISIDNGVSGTAPLPVGDPGTADNSLPRIAKALYLFCVA